MTESYTTEGNPNLWMFLIQLTGGLTKAENVLHEEVEKKLKSDSIYTEIKL